MRDLLRLLQLTSPALPVGAYAYSRGLEWATYAGVVHNEATAQTWILGLLQEMLVYLDAPVMFRLHQAWQRQDVNSICAWNRFLYASRESAEMRAEENQVGRALARLLCDLEIAAAQEWTKAADTTYVAMFALAAAQWEISSEDTCAGYLWAWAEQAVAAAIKLVPLGQTAGQRIMSASVETIPNVVAQSARLSDDDLGTSAPLLAIGSALHETQHTRLFRS